MAPILLLTVCIAISTYVFPSSSLEFEMQSSTKCIYEEISANALVVKDPHGQVIHTQEEDFLEESVATTIVKLDWKSGVAATDWSKIAKKEHLDDLAVALRKVDDNIREVYNEMLLLQQREQEMREISGKTCAMFAP
eukprot:gene7552-701_t